MLRKEQRFRYKKYIQLSTSRMTLKKLINILRAEYKLRTGNGSIKGIYPYTLVVDLHNRCNLHCPLCYMGLGKVEKRKNLMTAKNYRKLITPLKDYLLQVFLYNNTEPFLNKEVYDIIRINKSLNIGSVISSNLSLSIDPEKLVESGLEYLIASIDGITQNVYSAYRRGGQLPLVLSNLKSIIKEKKARNSKFPLIEWQCLVTKKNENQLQEIEDFAYDIGVDYVRFSNLNFYPVDNKNLKEARNEWLPNNPQYRAFEKEPTKGKLRKPCYWLWRSVIVSANGGVIPCCLYDTKDWGNLFEECFSDIWTGKNYSRARSLHTDNVTGEKGIICDNCTASFIWQ